MGRPGNEATGSSFLEGLYATVILALLCGLLLPITIYVYDLSDDMQFIV